uniref:Putative secreted protein n=1 Tax=Ixodes ricinus TaxID=34613 RepID=A0A6B0U5R4_IXORI
MLRATLLIEKIAILLHRPTTSAQHQVTPLIKLCLFDLRKFFASTEKLQWRRFCLTCGHFYHCLNVGSLHNAIELLSPIE